MTDEKYEFVQDIKSKKSTAQSAFKKRTHCGKGGRVRFPSDYLTKKERDAMNGECKSYRLNEPMKWDEFKAMPEDIQKQYIQILRNKFNVPTRYIAEMFGKTKDYCVVYLRNHGMSDGRRSGREKWDMDGWMKWCNGVTEEKASVAPDELHVDESQIPDMTEEGEMDIRAEVVLQDLMEQAAEAEVNWKQNYEKARDLNLELINDKAQMEKEICDLRMRLHQAMDFSNAVRPADQTDWEVEYRNCCVEKEELADECRRLTNDYQKLKLQMEAQQMMMNSMERRCDILQAKVEMAELIFGGRKCMAEV